MRETRLRCCLDLFVRIITTMCGGAIISDFIAVKRGRKLTAGDLWSELDPFSDLLGFDSSAASSKPQPPQKVPQVTVSKGKKWFFFKFSLSSHLFPWVILVFFMWCLMVTFSFFCDEKFSCYAFTLVYYFSFCEVDQCLSIFMINIKYSLYILRNWNKLR